MKEDTMIRINNITNREIFNFLLICLFLMFSGAVSGQSEKKYIRQGNREYEKNNFSDSEVAYRKAIDKNNESPDAVFNIGDALYKQNKFEDAGKQFVENINMNSDKNKKSTGLYNLGNSLLKANKLKECIDAYKGSLKLKPGNIEAKYNLAYAQDLLKQQEEQKKNENKKKQDQKQDKDKQDQDKDIKDKSDQNKDQQKEQGDKQDKKQENQDQKQSISKEDAQRLLNALANDEKNVQEKVKLAKAAKEKVRSVKNW